MKQIWIKASFPNIQYKKHPTRKNGVKFDRYFRGSYQVAGKRKAINFGWSSEGWSEVSVWEKINFYKNNAKIGSGPKSLKDERGVEENKKELEQKRIKLKERENIIFSDFFEDVYKPVCKTNKKPESWRKEIEHFNNWLNPEIGHLPIRKITAFNLEKIKKKMLDEGRAPRSIQYVFATFRQVWNYARLNDIVTHETPTRKVKLPKVNNKRLRYFTHVEVDILLEALKSKSQQVHDMTLFSLHTGARAGEVFSLTWGVVNLKNGTAQLRDGKGVDRHAYLTDATQSMLEQLHQGQDPSELVFTDSEGEKITKISNTFERTVKELGLNNGVTDSRDKAIFHTCRHTFASWHVQNGTDLYTVKELLGHSTIQLTERYSHLRPDGLKKAARDFDKSIIKNNIVPLEKTDNG
jgi:site-specific recombinase XerD